MNQEQWVKNNTIITILGGSRGYNTHTPDSDYDYRSITIPPLEEYIKLNNECIDRSFDKNNCKWITDDSVYYTINKFITLGIGANPNILELLFSSPENITIKHEVGQILTDNRELFLSQKCIGSYLGYTTAQLHRLENHRHWIINPVIKPNRIEYGLPEIPLYSKDTIKCSRHISHDLFHNDIVFNTLNLKSYLGLEYTYMDDWEKWKQYEKYLNGRNPERFKMEQLCTYDSKHAMHVIRLQNNCIELLRDGKLIVKRPEAEFLKTIRRGELPYNELIELINSNNNSIKSLKHQSPLPIEPDYVKIHNMLKLILDIYHNS